MTPLEFHGIAKTRDGRSLHPLYKYWKRVLIDCTPKKDKRLGFLDARWKDFWIFVEEIAPMFRKRVGKYFCRMDAHFPWCKENVWFVKSHHEMLFGRTTTYKAEIDGEILMTREIAKKVGLSQPAIQGRFAVGSKVDRKPYQGNADRLNIGPKTILLKSPGRYQRSPIKDVIDETGRSILLRRLTKFRVRISIKHKNEKYKMVL